MPPRSSGTEEKRLAPEDVLGACIMGLLLLITLANVIVRYMTQQSFAWTEEFSIFLLVALTLCGSAVAITGDAHLRIEYFYAKGSASRRRMLSWIATAISFAVFVLLSVMLVRTGLQERDFGETSTGLGLPRWWYTAALALLAVLVAFRGMQRLRRIAAGAERLSDAREAS